MDHYFEQILGALSDQSWREHDDPAERVLSFLDSVHEVMKGPVLKRGCLLGSMALDMSETHPEIREAIDHRLNQLAATIEPDLRLALRGGKKPAGISAGAMAKQFVAVLQGAIVLAKASADHRVLASMIRCHRELVRAALERGR